MIEAPHIKKSLWTKIKYKYWEIWPYNARPGITWYNFKCWIWHRYSTLRCRYLPHTWCDRRELLLHMSFEILCQFLEKECSPGHVQWYGDCHHQVMVNGVMKNVMDEMRELEWWWKEVYQKEYPKKMDELWKLVEPVSPRTILVSSDDMPDCVAGKLEFIYKDDEVKIIYKGIMNQIHELEQHMDEKAEEMLKRLTAIRLWMWT